MRRPAALALILAVLGFTPGLSAAAATERPVPPAAAKMSILLDLNAASYEELLSVRGIGPALAGRIIEYRNTHGSFARIEDLLKIKGIGEKSLARLRRYLTLSAPPSPEANVTPPSPR